MIQKRKVSLIWDETGDISLLFSFEPQHFGKFPSHSKLHVGSCCSNVRIALENCQSKKPITGLRQINVLAQGVNIFMWTLLKNSLSGRSDLKIIKDRQPPNWLLQTRQQGSHRFDTCAMKSDSKYQTFTRLNKISHQKHLVSSNPSSIYTHQHSFTHHAPPTTNRQMVHLPNHPVAPTQRSANPQSCAGEVKLLKGVTCHCNFDRLKAGVCTGSLCILYIYIYKYIL